ncbi:hypothetical protein THAOC_24012 [Thalassiosira oceanica]|uniref:Uncharacterized protein n=1 Tax=Thalassiosira oceanica TaxID=159749 RepID=K0SBT0_THAOC|nr:hypothetical protein THAOC_24012 [Thalassiosira oceanica]|eukprot:EJK56157.1 hypothetical protein THAOC_24012 [Thalassiosira oceanica]
MKSPPPQVLGAADKVVVESSRHTCRWRELPEYKNESRAQRAPIDGWTESFQFLEDEADATRSLSARTPPTGVDVDKEASAAIPLTPQHSDGGQHPTSMHVTLSLLCRFTSTSFNGPTVFYAARSPSFRLGPPCYPACPISRSRQVSALVCAPARAAQTQNTYLRLHSSFSSAPPPPCMRPPRPHRLGIGLVPGLAIGGVVLDAKPRDDIHGQKQNNATPTPTQLA